MEDLLKEFEKIEIRPVNRLDAEDREVCESLQEQFERTLAQIREWNALYLKKHREAPSPWYHNYYGATQVTAIYEIAGLCPFGRYEIIPLKGLEECSTNAALLCEKFESAIIDHFNRRYGARLVSDGGSALQAVLFGDRVERHGGIYTYRNKERDKFVILPEKGGTPHYGTVLENIFGQLGGMSFNEKRDAEQTAEFGKEVRYHGSELKGRSVSLQGFTRIYTRYDGTKELNYDFGDYLAMVLNAIRIAFGEKENATFDPIDKDNGFGAEAELHGSSAAKSIRPFKNGKLTVTFFSSDQAQRFHDFTEATRQRFLNQR